MILPKVSVLIPTYNYAHYLDETIQSVLDQTFIDFELVIVDNCSTDNTHEVVKKYLSDKRVSFYVNETNVGLVGNWNKCLDYASGEYIKFLCADDRFHPQLLEKFVDIMDQHPSVSVIGSFYEIFGTKNFCRIPSFKGQVSGELVRKSLLGYRNRLSSPSVVMFRKNDVKKIGHFNPELLQCTDREYYFRLLTIGDCYVIPESLCYVRSHPNTQSVMIGKKIHEGAFERYRFMTSVKMATKNKSDITFLEINSQLKQSAFRCAKVFYKVLPRLDKKKNRIIFKNAFKIGYSEGVLLAPLSYYFKVGILKNLLKKI